ncbi:hypothetical protein KORDIASMS9_01885 [Kordia sp. SMS9]|nr:hypothetical protein KORDIASMS9_01885 [Kordia sp. SMS9]
MKIIDRILVFIKHKNLSMRAFDQSINVGNGYTSKQSKSKASVGSDVLERIIGTYPDLNPLWLLTGDGKMTIELTKDEKNTNGTDESPLQYNSIDEIIDHKIERAMQRQIQLLLDKLDTFPTMEEIREEIRKTQDNS